MSLMYFPAPTLMRLLYKSNEVTDAPLAIELLYPPERYLTFAMRYNPSNKPVTLLVNGSSTAAQRFSKGGGGWPGLCAWLQDNNCSETGSHTCAITKKKCIEQRRDVFKPRFPLSCLVCSTSDFLVWNNHRNSTARLMHMSLDIQKRELVNTVVTYLGCLLAFVVVVEEFLWIHWVVLSMATLQTYKK